MQQKKYQIKLNDEVIDTERIMRDKAHTSKGSIRKGISHKAHLMKSAILESTHQPRLNTSDLGNDGHKSSRNKESTSIFGGNNVQAGGPGQYQVNDSMLHRAAPTMTIAHTGRTQKKSVQKQMETYLQKILSEQSGRNTLLTSMNGNMKAVTTVNDSIDNRNGL